MKFRLPQGCVRLSHAGKTVTIAGDGSVELDPGTAALLAPHGIAPIGDPAPIDPAQVDALPHADLVAALAARDVAIPPKASDVALRGLLRQALAKPSR